MDQKEATTLEFQLTLHLKKLLLDVKNKLRLPEKNNALLVMVLVVSQEQLQKLVKYVMAKGKFAQLEILY
jgi:hypothetical protein